MSESSEVHPTPSARRWLRFSLRTALVLVTVYCVWLAVVTLQARRQKQALTRVEQLGGRIAFSFELDDQGNWRDKPYPLVPAAIRTAIGEDYFRRVAIINFDEGSDPTDDDLRLLQSMPHLTQLTLANRTRITDAGLEHLAGLRRLNVLVLDGTSVTGPGLRHLQNLRLLEGLTLSSTPLADSGVEYLAKLSHLKWLHLNDTNITDAALIHLAKLRSLESLQLVNTPITDAGLTHLESLDHLRRILLRGTRTSHEGRAALQKALPNCRVPQ